MTTAEPVGSDAARVAWLSIAPVKSMRLQTVDAIELESTGVHGDRRYYVVDDGGSLANAKRVPQLLTMRAEVVDRRLVLHFPDGADLEVDDVLGERIETSFYGRPVLGRIVEGTWNDALSEFAGARLRLVKTEREGDGYDRGAAAGASLVSVAALDALRAAAESDSPVDGRRFRMTVGVDGVQPHAEDGWIGSRVRLGGAVVLVRENVGRCAVTTRDPETGVRDLDTLGAIAEYRAHVPTTEPLPFGVWCEVVQPGRVAVGDAVEVE